MMSAYHLSHLVFFLKSFPHKYIFLIQLLLKPNAGSGLLETQTLCIKMYIYTRAPYIASFFFLYCGLINNLLFFFYSMTSHSFNQVFHIKSSLRKLPSHVGKGWLHQWFFSHTSGSSWLSLQPESQPNDTVDPMEKSCPYRIPFTGMPGSRHEQLSTVTPKDETKINTFNRSKESKAHPILFAKGTVML